jgi:deazaflavin-dependent oxidoreductase (nitroreductase family)
VAESVEQAALNQAIIDEFRAGNGRVTHPMVPDGIRLAVLTTTGARTGGRHTCVVAHHRIDSNRVAVIASAFGAATHPDWYRNLVANPEATLELPGSGELTVLAVTARTALGAERDQLIADMARESPIMADFTKNEHREIPVVVLEY